MKVLVVFDQLEGELIYATPDVNDTQLKILKAANGGYINAGLSADEEDAVSYVLSSLADPNSTNYYEGLAGAVHGQWFKNRCLVRSVPLDITECILVFTCGFLP